MHSTHLLSPVFHVALVVFAAIQVHETKAALVQFPNCDGSDNYVVCPTVIYSFDFWGLISFLQSCGGSGTLYSKVEHLLITVPCIIALAWFIMIFFVRALYYEFGYVVCILLDVCCQLDLAGPSSGEWEQTLLWRVSVWKLLPMIILRLCYQAMYQFYEVLICLLKFDFFAFTGVTIQVSVSVRLTVPSY